jgi:hypothetical protein
MLQIPASPSSETLSLITFELAETADLLRVFLDLCYGVGPPMMPLDLASSIEGICRKYDADRLRKDIARSLTAFTRKCSDAQMAREIFKLASKWDDPDLAASAQCPLRDPNHGLRTVVGQVQELFHNIGGFWKHEWRVIFDSESRGAQHVIHDRPCARQATSELLTYENVLRTNE